MSRTHHVPSAHHATATAVGSVVRHVTAIAHAAGCRFFFCVQPDTQLCVGLDASHLLLRRVLRVAEEICVVALGDIRVRAQAGFELVLAVFAEQRVEWVGCCAT